MPEFSDSSLKQLATVDQRLQDILIEAIKKVDFIVLEGHRDQAAQEAAVAAGNSKLHWPLGKHNAMPSNAVDIAPYVEILNPNGTVGHIDWKDLPSFARLMGYIERIADEKGIKLRFGLDWNGNWRTMDEKFIDAPHVELAE